MDSDFGPFFLKFPSYFPYNAKLCINGHHWAQRQAAMTGIGFTAMDTGLAILADPDLPRPLRVASTAYQTAIDKLTATVGLAA